MPHLDVADEEEVAAPLLGGAPGDSVLDAGDEVAEPQPNPEGKDGGFFDLLFDNDHFLAAYVIGTIWTAVVGVSCVSVSHSTGSGWLVLLAWLALVGAQVGICVATHASPALTAFLVYAALISGPLGMCAGDMMHQAEFGDIDQMMGLSEEAARTIAWTIVACTIIFYPVPLLCCLWLAEFCNRCTGGTTGDKRGEGMAKYGGVGAGAYDDP